MKQNQGRKEEVQKCTKNAIKKGKHHCRKKEEKSMKARKEQPVHVEGKASRARLSTLCS